MSSRRQTILKRTPEAERCRRKFLRFFPGGFADETYIVWERGYKADAHRTWIEVLNQTEHRRLLRQGRFSEVALRAVRIESKTNLLFSFEKMALRDAVRSTDGAERFARGLWAYLHGSRPAPARFDAWCDVIAALPRRQTRVLTWPLVTVFGFLAKPEEHMFLKPNVTRKAAGEYAYAFEYVSKPNWRTYESLLHFAQRVQADNADLGPRDMIDAQSFIWVQGSDEYDEA